MPTFLTVATLQLGACGEGETPDPTGAGTESSSTSATTDAESSTASTTDATTMTSATNPTSTSTDADTGTTSAESGSDDTGTQSSDSGTTRADSTDTGTVENCSEYPDEATCIAVEICHWTPPGYCDVTCDAILDEAECSEQLACIWLDAACEYNGI